MCFVTLNLLCATIKTFVDSVEQDQAAENLQSDS